MPATPIPLATTVTLAMGLLALVAGTVVPRRGAWSAFCLVGFLGASAALGVELAGAGEPDPLRVVFDVLFLFVGAAFVATLAGVTEGVDARSRSTAALAPGAVTTAVGCGMLAAWAADAIVLVLGLEVGWLAVNLLLIRASLVGSADDDAGRRAALMHLVTGAVGLLLLLSGLALMQSETGTFVIDGMVSAVRPPSDDGPRPASSPRAVLAVVLVLSGLAIRLRLVPFSAGEPEVHSGTNPWIAGVVALVPRVTGTLVLLRLLPVLVGLGENATRILLLLAAGLTALVGGVRAVRGTNLRGVITAANACHFAAVPAVVAVAVWEASHPGAGLAAGRDLPAGVEAALLQLVVHVLVAVGSTAVVVHASRAERPLDFVEDLGGLSRVQPAAACCLAIVGLAAAGLPPTLGFWSRALVPGAVVSVPGSSHRVFLLVALLLWLSSAMLLVGLGRLVAAAWFDPPRGTRPPRGGEPALAVAVLVAIALVGFGAIPGPLLEWLRVAATGAN